MLKGIYYHPDMRVGNVFSHVCVSIYFCVYLFRLLPLSPSSSFYVGRYIFIISRSSIKVIGLRSYEKNDNFTYFNISILCIWLLVINNVMVTHQGPGHTKVKVQISIFFQFYVKFYLFCRSRHSEWRLRVPV